MELSARIGEEPGEVSHALEVAHTDGVPLEGHRPVVTLPTEDVGARRQLRLGWLLVHSGDLRCHRRGCLDRFEDRAGRALLQGCSVLAAAGAVGRRRDRCVRAPPRTGRRPRSRVAPLRRRKTPRPRRRPRRAARCLERRPRWPRAPCSRIGRRRARARRRPIEPGRRRRPRSRSRPAPRAAGRAEGRCSVVAPSRACAAGARGRLGWRRPRWPRLLGPDAPARGPAGDPTRRDEPPRALPPRPAMSPLCSRIRPSSFSGHPSSRRR